MYSLMQSGRQRRLGNRRPFDLFCVTLAPVNIIAKRKRTEVPVVVRNSPVPRRLEDPVGCPAHTEEIDHYETSLWSRQTEGVVFCSNKGPDFRSLECTPRSTRKATEQPPARAPLPQTTHLSRGRYRAFCWCFLRAPIARGAQRPTARESLSLLFALSHAHLNTKESLHYAGRSVPIQAWSMQFSLILTRTAVLNF